MREWAKFDWENRSSSTRLGFSCCGKGRLRKQRIGQEIEKNNLLFVFSYISSEISRNRAKMCRKVSTRNEKRKMRKANGRMKMYVFIFNLQRQRFSFLAFIISLHFRSTLSFSYNVRVQDTDAHEKIDLQVNKICILLRDSLSKCSERFAT